MKFHIYALIFIWNLTSALTSDTDTNETPGLLSAHVLSFDDFAAAFGKTYASPEEAEYRRSIFDENIRRIRQHQEMHPRPSYRLGINEFLDLKAQEVPKGYDKNTFNLLSSTSRSLFELDEVIDVEPIENLPLFMDWRAQGVTTPVKTQGHCGSCWAFATTSVVESQVAIQTGVLYTLGVQELVSCVENPLQCGGSGGCAGSTAPLAFDYILSRRGMVEEWFNGYTSYGGNVDVCVEEEDNTHRVAGINGYIALPHNDQVSLMNAVAKIGPVAVSVAAHSWHLYAGGVFNKGFDEDADSDMNHLVVLEGYGTDQETGQDFWLVRNSWGPRWGEGGYIRLLRSNETMCGVDVTPSHGDACTKDGDGNDITPPFQVVCGTSGVLAHPVVPFGGHLV